MTPGIYLRRGTGPYARDYHPGPVFLLGRSAGPAPVVEPVAGRFNCLAACVAAGWCVAASRARRTGELVDGAGARVRRPRAAARMQAHNTARRRGREGRAENEDGYDESGMIILTPSGSPSANTFAIGEQGRMPSGPSLPRCHGYVRHAEVHIQCQDGPSRCEPFSTHVVGTNCRSVPSSSRVSEHNRMCAQFVRRARESRIARRSRPQCRRHVPYSPRYGGSDHQQR